MDYTMDSNSSTALNSLRTPISQQLPGNDCSQGLAGSSSNLKLVGVQVIPETKPSTNSHYIFAGTKEKLYCKVGAVVPITFDIVGERDPRSRIRVRAVYTDHSILDTPVVPCPNHLAKDDSNARMHFVRCQHAGTEYLDENGNYSLRIPLCEQAGFMFTCFSSCSGGINRRPVVVTFELELGGESSLEVCCLPLKVCAKPYRDACMDDEKMLRTAFMRKTPKCKEWRTTRKPSPNPRCDDSTSGALEIRVKFDDPAKVSKCLWYLRHEEKFDSLISMAMDNISFRDFHVLTPGIGIKAWLSRPSIGLASLADIFERNSITTLGDLAGIYRNDIFARLGFTPNECSVLNKAFQEWHHQYSSMITNSSRNETGLNDW